MLATLVLTSVLLQPQQPRLKVFILAGQSNMEGKGMPAPLAWQVSQPQYQERWKSFIKDSDYAAFTQDYEASVAKDPKNPIYDWSERDDVWIDFHERHGNLSVGYSDRKNAFGPEVTFGQAMGDRYKEPVLLIKTAWGGKAIARGFLPPSERDTEAKWQAIAKNENKTVEEVKQTHGEFYDLMVKEIDDALANIKQNHPAYQGQGYQIKGFVWFQGFNDQFGPGYPDAYLHNMTAFINDVRKKYGDIPFVIGQMGQDADKNGVYPVD
ncbi:MAG TPA: sialate O-acetylesterase [Fimbriimonadaceae bacterium]|nr:sialate O-acetylesterase [Fimbriimonadaceae bacterium]